MASRWALRILTPVIFSFVLWSLIWLLTAGGPGPSFEIVHVTRPLVGWPGFLFLVFYSSLFSVLMVLLMASILPNALLDRGWSHPAAWAISGAILSELLIWVAGIFLFGLGKVTAIQSMRDAALINWVLWVAVALPYGAIYAIFLRRKIARAGDLGLEVRSFHLNRP